MPSFDTGSSNPTINRNRLHPFKIAIPKYDEQEKIAEFIDKKAGEIDSLKEQAEFLVPILQERRSALISAAVTGQIDVRGLAEAVA